MFHRALFGPLRDGKKDIQKLSEVLGDSQNHQVACAKILRLTSGCFGIITTKTKINKAKENKTGKSMSMEKPQITEGI